VRRHGQGLVRSVRVPAEDNNAANVLAATALPVIATDLRGSITVWNDAAERWFGWSADEVLGQSVARLTPDHLRGEFAMLVARLRRGEVVEPIDTARRTRDGREIAIRLLLSPVHDEYGELAGLSMFALENAGEDETSRALAASEARYRTLVQTLTEFVVVTNAYGRVNGPQPSWQEYTGQKVEDAAALGWRQALHRDDRVLLDVQWDRRTVRRTPFAFGARVFNAETASYRQCQCHAAPIRDDIGRVVEWVIAFTDVHERHLAEERERKTADRFRRIFDANVFGVCYGEGRTILDANDAMLEIMGAPRSELAASIALDRLMPPPEDPDALPFGDGQTGEYEIRRLDGGFGYVVAAGVDLAPDRGWLAVAVDVTQRKVAEREIEHRAMHDSLTGLPNRRLLVDRLEHALARAGRQGALVGVLFCDLDYFKEINDAHGHACGDAALQAVAQRLQSVLREGDTVARSGGDEFVIVLEDLLEAVEAGRIAERVREALLDPVMWKGEALKVTCSIGVATSTGIDDPVEALINRADDAMYVAKQMGRDQIAFGAESIQSHSHRRLVERELRRALDGGAFDLEFQPVIDLRDGLPVGAEALLRWKLNGELVPTDEVISVAEETDLMTRVSDWVIRRACRDFAQWRALHAGAAEWKLHVNVSARDLADDDVARRVLDGIACGGLEPSDVCVEVTESAMLFEVENVAERLAALRTAGVTVAIDDFGSGYASLGVLRDIPADIVKIDRAFVATIGDSDRDRAIVEHAIDLAHSLGLVVVGEGVETLSQLSILEELGCDRVQGYAFAAPRPLDEFEPTV